MPKVYLIDVTNRDGVQTSRIGLAKLQKTMLNIMLNEMGVFQTELGFPFTRHEANYINGNLELQEKGFLTPIVLEGWCRGIPKDVQDALRLTPTIRDFNLSISTSDQMIANKFRGKLDRDSIIAEMTEAVQAAREGGARTVGVNSEDASRTDMGYLVRFAKAVKDSGADRMRYCDTLGYDDPNTIYQRINHIAQEVGLPIELHCHNDLGMVIANSVMGAKGAIDAGVDAYINTTVNGVGERAGNADITSVILALKYSSLKELDLLDERVDLSKAWKISKYASYAFGLPIPINQPGVGANAFAHESGIHADGALKDRKNYELYDYEELGRGDAETMDTGRVITTGEYGGIRGFLKVYEDLGIQFENSEAASRGLELCQYANLHTGKPLHDDELRFIAAYPEQAAKIMTVTP
jgi:homocitrate synthase NifV